jgi:hypothetical protein
MWRHRGGCGGGPAEQRLAGLWDRRRQLGLAGGHAATGVSRARRPPRARQRRPLHARRQRLPPQPRALRPGVHARLQRRPPRAAVSHFSSAATAPHARVSQPESAAAGLTARGGKLGAGSRMEMMRSKPQLTSICSRYGSGGGSMPSPGAVRSPMRSASSPTRLHALPVSTLWNHQEGFDRSN